jgi:hypothetical protein
VLVPSWRFVAPVSVPRRATLGKLSGWRLGLTPNPIVALAAARRSSRSDRGPSGARTAVGGGRRPALEVVGHARPFTRSVAALPRTTSALLRRVTAPRTAVRREAAYGIAADKLLTAGVELHSIWRTSVRAETDGRSLLLLRLHRRTLQHGEGLFTVLMCADCQAARGHGSGPYPVMTRAEMRAGLDLLPTWALEQKAAANRQVIAVMRRRLGAGEEVAPMYQEPGLAWLERQAKVAEELVAQGKRTTENRPGSWHGRGRTTMLARRSDGSQLGRR